MIIDKDMWLKQIEAKQSREAKLEQLRHLDTITEETYGLSATDMILSLERNFFLNRKQANAILSEWMNL